MKKTTKGAAAAGTAAVLLLGGAGSLAYWTSSKSISGGSVTAGSMSLGDPSCGGWLYAAGKAGAGTAVNKFVPGDVISKTCTFTLNGTGDNLKANLAVTPATLTATGTPAGTSLKADITAAYTVGSTTVTPPYAVTSTDFGKTVTAVITVSFPYGTDETGSPKVNANDMQNVSAALSDINVTLTQTNPN